MTPEGARHRGHPLGVEITTPRRVPLAALNRALEELKLPPRTRGEFAPLAAGS